MKKNLYVISIILILVIVIFCINQKDKFTLQNNNKQNGKIFAAANPFGMDSLQISDTMELLDLIINITGGGLPYVRGMGKVPDLHTAIKNDKTGRLKKLVKEFISPKTKEEKRMELADKILELWVKVEDVDEHSRGEFINAKHLVIIERFQGEDFYSIWEAEHGGAAPQNPNIKAGGILESLYAEIAAWVYSELTAQSLVKDLYLKLNAQNPYSYIDYTPVIETLKKEIRQNPKRGKERVVQFARTVQTFRLGGNFNNIPNKNSFYNVFTSNDRETKWLIDSFGKVPYKLGDKSALQSGEAIRTPNDIPLYDFHSRYGDDVVYGSDKDDNFMTGTGDDILDGGDGNDTLDAGSGCNRIYGGRGNDTIIGGKMCDTIYAGEGDDTLLLQYEGDGRNNNSINHILGGTGNDNINSKYTNDWYYFYPKDGNDVIEDIGGNDALIFPEGVSWDDLIFEREDNNLLIKFKNFDDSIKIINWFKSDEYKIERIDIPNAEPLSKSTNEIVIKS